MTEQWVEFEVVRKMEDGSLRGKLVEHWEDSCPEIIALRAREAKLREALKPFAEAFETGSFWVNEGNLTLPRISMHDLARLYHANKPKEP